ncbi:hypothetical protein MTR_2g042135 [Medicago truncatula]|uniref:Uncharacterized protein n=1 Tax=Medicago truncatula TaxID=3880 RepID=A0A072V6X3_MEDTR|nr:hypothetical protein MTR_2g042135 [Medicago truncatula]
MHVVPTRASSPQHKEYNYTHRASSPQLKEQKITGHLALNAKSKSSQGIKPSTSNEYAWTQQRKSAQKSVADFELHSSSKISLTMRFSLKNHSWITRLNTRLPN